MFTDAFVVYGKAGETLRLFYSHFRAHFKATNLKKFVNEIGALSLMHPPIPDCAKQVHPHLPFSFLFLFAYSSIPFPCLYLPLFSSLLNFLLKDFGILRASIDF
jgi:hypothetical protein